MDNLGLYLIALIIPLIAQLYVNSSYNKYKQIKNSKGMSGLEVARKILDKNGLSNVYVVETRGNLTDHYDPTRKVVKLSSDIFHGETVAAMAVAAHECGHAIQDKDKYLFMRIRSFIFPIVSFGTKFAYIVLILGMFLSLIDLIWLGIALVGLGLLFQIVTLPVEFDASKRALKELESTIKMPNSDINGSKTMLNAAAMTYVAGVLSSALEIFRLILIASNRDR